MDVTQGDSIGPKRLIQDAIPLMTPSSRSIPRAKRGISRRRSSLPLAERRWSEPSSSETPKKLLKLATHHLSSASSSPVLGTKRPTPKSDDKLETTTATKSPRNSDSFQVPAAVGRRGRQVQWDKKLHSPLDADSFAAAVDARILDEKDSTSSESSSTSAAKLSKTKSTRNSDSFTALAVVGRRGRQVQWNKKLHSPLDANSFAAAVDARLVDLRDGTSSDSSNTSAAKLSKGKSPRNSDSFLTPAAVGRRGRQIQWHKKLHSSNDADSFAAAVAARLAAERDNTAESSSTSVAKLPKERLSTSLDATLKASSKIDKETLSQKDLKIPSDPLVAPPFTPYSSPRMKDTSTWPSVQKRLTRASQSSQKSSSSLSVRSKDSPAIGRETLANIPPDENRNLIIPDSTPRMKDTSMWKSTGKQPRRASQSLDKSTTSLQTSEEDLKKGDEYSSPRMKDVSTRTSFEKHPGHTSQISRKSLLNVMPKPRISEAASVNTSAEKDSKLPQDSIESLSFTPRCTSPSPQKSSASAKTALKDSPRTDKRTLAMNSSEKDFKIPQDPLSANSSPRMKDVSPQNGTNKRSRRASKSPQKPDPVLSVSKVNRKNGSLSLSQLTLMEMSRWTMPKPMATSTPAFSTKQDAPSSDQLDQHETPSSLFTPRINASYSNLIQTRRSLASDDNIPLADPSKNSSVETGRHSRPLNSDISKKVVSQVQDDALTDLPPLENTAPKQKVKVTNTPPSSLTGNSSHPQVDDSLLDQPEVVQDRRAVRRPSASAGKTSFAADSIALISIGATPTSKSGRGFGVQHSSRSSDPRPSLKGKKSTPAAALSTRKSSTEQPVAGPSSRPVIQLRSERPARNLMEIEEAESSEDEILDENFLPPAKKKKLSTSAAKPGRQTVPRGRTRKASIPGLLPMTYAKNNFEHFLKKRIDQETVECVQKQTNAFVDVVEGQLGRLLAKKRKEKYLEPGDVIKFFQDCQIFDEPFEDIVRELYPLEYQEKLIPVAQAFNKVHF